MDAIKSALEEALHETIHRLNGLGGGVAFEDDSGAFDDDDRAEAGGDAVSVGEEREMAFTVRGRLVDRANRLAEAIDRIRAGEYGVYQRCAEPIAPARLRALPEVETCVVCQDAQERRARKLAAAR